MFYIISWIFIIEILGILFFPIAALVFSNLRDQGFSISKPLGVLMLGFISWISASLHIFPVNQGSLSITLLIISIPSIYIFYKNKSKFISFFKENKNVIVFTEAIWILVFLLWVIYRSYDPSINHTEQPMDHGLLTASIKTTLGTPKDIWLSSYSVNYYYFGHWMMGIIAKISQTPPQIAYNLALAIIPSLGSSAIFGLICNISRSLPSRKLNLLIAGITTFIFLNISSNLEPVLEFLNQLKLIPLKLVAWIDISGLNSTSAISFISQDHWWWWRASRIISSRDVGGVTDYTIQEFPAFSFLLGDLHPHVMAIPFLVIFISFCWNILKSPKTSDFRSFQKKSSWNKMFPSIPDNLNLNSSGGIIVVKNIVLHKVITIFSISLLLGALSFLNIWDLPTLWILLISSITIWSYQNNNFSTKLLFSEILPYGFVSLLLACILFYPYFGTFSSSIKGLAVVETNSRPIHMLIVWGVLILPIIPFIFITFAQTKINYHWKKLVTISSVVAFAPYLLMMAVASVSNVEINLWIRIFQTSPLAILIAICIYTTLWEAKFVGLSGKVFVLMLSSIAIGLVLGSELLYIDDLFSSPYERMNTLFKLYYQACILMIISSSFSIIYGIQFIRKLKGLGRGLGMAISILYLIIFSSSLYYTPATILSKIDISSNSQTLDGLAYLKEESSEYEIIEYLLKNYSPEDILLESVGEWGNAGLISRSSGVPNVLNWPGHQIQWRGRIAEFEIRQRDIRTVFLTPSIDAAKFIMMKYRINYVYIGPRESKAFDKSSTDKFARFMDIVVNTEHSKLYYWEY